MPNPTDVGLGGTLPGTLSLSVGVRAKSDKLLPAFFTPVEEPFSDIVVGGRTSVSGLEGGELAMGETRPAVPLEALLRAAR
jgi:hypothetical protein